MHSFECDASLNESTSAHIHTARNTKCEYKDQKGYDPCAVYMDSWLAIMLVLELMSIVWNFSVH